MGLNFRDMGCRRIVETILKDSPSYQVRDVQRAAREKGPEDIGECLRARDRMDVPFMIDLLGLPPVPPAADKEMSWRNAEVALKKTDQEHSLENELERQEAYLRGIIGEHEKTITANNHTIDTLLREKKA